MKQRNPAKIKPAVSAIEEKGDRWVFFDGDNTLWHIEALYDHARKELVRYIGESGADAAEIDDFQRLEDKRLFEELGYSATRFATSFENTLRWFVPGATTTQLGRARRLAQSVFEMPAEIDPDTLGVLSCLRSSHHLALVTAGERWVQERRLAAFRYSNMFDIIQIVERKTALLFRELAADLAIGVQQSWVVGDSLRSDIMPALEAGLNAVLIANHNWIEVEHVDNQPSNLKVVNRLADVVPIIVTAGHELPAPVHP
jgi:putative hydrolase of the HAD superfamily